MSMHPKGPLPKKQQQVQVDLKQADTITCKRSRVNCACSSL